MTAGRDPKEGSRRATGSARHIPVLLSEVLASLAPRAGETYIDATFGAGGYTEAILAAADCRVLALDRDPAAVAAASELAVRSAGRLAVVEAPFSQLEQMARKHLGAADIGLPFARSGPLSSVPRRGMGGLEPSRTAQVDGVVFDIGVSSMQLDEAARGFSFQADGPLDMRMGREGPTAADFLRTASEGEIADVLFHYGEERRSRAIARAVVAARSERPLTRTLELADLVRRVLKGRPDGHHPATRTFQALRIHINDELGELARGLSAAEHVLKAGGRLVVVTFHSLEDRIAKRFLAARSGKAGRGSRHGPPVRDPDVQQSFRLLNPRPLTPSEDEVGANIRARSARLRAAIRTEAPAAPLDLAALAVVHPGASASG